jgi:phage replication-related protein YjqB (UPF0714/DUF867 family)
MRIRNFLVLFLFTAVSGCYSGALFLRRGPDVYRDFAALKAANTEGLDYSREAYDRGSKVAVFAIHGGDIERTISRLARHVAGADFNLYLFNGWHGNSADLHVTAAHFDDPDAVRIATSSVLGIALHAQADNGSRVCVGGSNAKAAALTVSRLKAAGFLAETPCVRLPGAAASNIVNRPSKGGVQLELTLRLLDRLERDPGELSKFAGAVRAAALAAVNSTSN